MLLFINIVFPKGTKERMFQYITCYSLSVVTPSTVVSTNLVSIHHMLLFIHDAGVQVMMVTGFQYITCYSLSPSKMRICLYSRCFNTSHVTLYPMQIFLSHLQTVVSIHHMLLFIQYSETRLKQ